MSEELARRIEQAESERLTRLKQSLNEKWHERERDLDRQIKESRDESDKIREMYEVNLKSEITRRETELRQELAEADDEEKKKLNQKATELERALDQANRAAEVERERLEGEFQAQLDKERERAFKEAAAEARRDAKAKVEELEKKTDQMTRQLGMTEQVLAGKTKELAKLEEDHRAKLEQITDRAKSEALEIVRRSFETDLQEKDLAIQRLKLESEEDRIRLQKQIQDLNRRIEKKTADELGRVPEEELERLLRKEFPNDKIVHLGKGKAGGDLLQTIIADENEVGLIVYEVKNTLNWNNDFVEQAKSHRTTYKTPYVILVSRVFPAGQEDFAEKDGILIVTGDKAPILARILRQSLLDIAREKAAGNEVGTKAAELYAYLRDPEFRERLRAIFGSVERLRALQEQEQRAHKRLWEKEAKEHRTIHTHLSDVEGKVSSIVEGRVIHIPVPKRARKADTSE